MPKSGRQIADRIYRELERNYRVTIVDGEIDQFRSDNMPHKLYMGLYESVAAIERTVARLPVAERPRKKRTLRSKQREPV